MQGGVRFPFLLSAGGSQLDPAGSRYADNTTTFTYKFALPGGEACRAG